MGDALGSPVQSFTLQRRVGRVIEARVFALKTVNDANEYSRELAAHVARVPADVRPVLCADHRPVAIYSQPVTDRLTELFLQMNARIERIAILVAPTNATLALQLTRIVRQARYPERRLFHDAAGAVKHLSAALDPAERQRVREFLMEFPDAR